jgi:hypothetical protein
LPDEISLAFKEQWQSVRLHIHGPAPAIWLMSCPFDEIPLVPFSIMSIPPANLFCLKSQSLDFQVSDWELGRALAAFKMLTTLVLDYPFNDENPMPITDELWSLATVERLELLDRNPTPFLATISAESMTKLKSLTFTKEFDSRNGNILEENYAALAQLVKFIGPISWLERLTVIMADPHKLIPALTSHSSLRFLDFQYSYEHPLHSNVFNASHLIELLENCPNLEEIFLDLHLHFVETETEDVRSLEVRSLDYPSRSTANQFF